MEHYRERYDLVQISYCETYEDQLGVALIRSGDSVIILMKWVLYTNKGGTATYFTLVPFELLWQVESEELFLWILMQCKYLQAVKDIIL